MSERPRLSDATLARLPGDVERPRYDRRTVRPGIVHLGVGAFHRAHQAVATEAVLNAGAGEWGITAASLRSADTRDALMPQDGLYTVSVREPAGERLQVIGAISDVLVAPHSPQRLLAAMADPAIRIVSLTVTEKGYCLDPASGALDADHPDIVHDLAHGSAPRSVPGFLVAALATRRAEGVAPFTVLCCDNLPANGRTVKRAIGAFAALRDDRLARYIADDVACPSTMVDRIVPATVDEDRQRIARMLGVSDAWPVVSEPFSQFVIEDVFPGGRPDWTLGGAEFVNDVAPYELMKLRLLNGAHSCLAYLGYLAGHETVADATNDPRFTRFLARLWGEAAASLPERMQRDAGAYTSRLLARFQNTAIRHRLLQIAMDGSQKLPQRLLNTIRDNLAAGRPVDHLVLGVAGFCVYASGQDERGQAIDVRDPLAAEMKARLGDLRAAPDSAARRVLQVQALFGELGHEPAFAATFTRALSTLVRNGVKVMLAG
ncbi:mannitol dehydrogenase family protein [Candidatus Raskinella chloraquaticus]|jgi:fructuronate reductase|uniref:Mannitol dehydrogenase n=1 Tax=Candidatus Raskinella chloraquaticus TaxID=1951219 RepID=A0A1W9HZR7_9HYPH|nr:MAG: mannitol dehydrogenase [Proteobacteria bacterium SG_bin8]